MYLKHWNFLVQEQLFTRINLTVMAKHNIHGGISRFINTWRQVAIKYMATSGYSGRVVC